MLPLKDFYFVRHAQTIWSDEEIQAENTNKSITDLGKKQAAAIRSVIATLPIATVCHSPLLRALQTTDLITEGLKTNRVLVDNLKECTFRVWMHMVDQVIHDEENVKAFFQQTLEGMHQSLSHPGPVLVVAHAGVYWSLCHQLQVDTPRIIDHCRPVHFQNIQGKWTVKFLPLTEEREQIGITAEETIK